MDELKPDEVEAYAWVRFEIISFYLYLFSAVSFLFMLSIRGQVGWTDTDAKTKNERFKFDPLEYYGLDLHWNAFSFVIVGLHSIYLIIYSTRDEVYYLDTFRLMLLIGGRLAMMTCVGLYD